MKEINNIFTKKDLRNGDIAMNRLGESLKACSRKM